MPLSLDTKLRDVGADFAYFPEQLDKLKFSTATKQKLNSVVYPTLKEFVDNKVVLICVDTSKCTDFTEKERLFGYLYTYSVAHNLDKKKIPVIRTRDQLQKSIARDEDMFLEEDCPLLFIDGVTRNADYYDKKALLDFSNFLYERASNGLITVLSFTNDYKGTQFLTTFMYNYLCNTAEFIDVG